MDLTCSNPCCFFCTMKEPDPSLRKSGITKCFKEMPLTNDQEHVLVLSGLWNIAMTQPDDPEFPSLGIFQCMSSLISKGINDRNWLLKDQNIYIPYYATHVIGSYTMNKADFAEKAVESGVIPPLIELLQGKLTWVEQRVAVRALGHLASYENSFDSMIEYEEEIVELAMGLASKCVEVVYVEFVGVKDEKKRLKYHCDLLTRGVGGIEMENRKAEEWTNQIQCWSIYLLNCFASEERCLNQICKHGFLEDLCEMWGGLMNHSSPSSSSSSPGGVGLIRILCYSSQGRKKISESEKVLKFLSNLSRSSDDWQYIGIDCLLLLLKDPDTRIKVIKISSLILVDLIEIQTLGGRNRVGEAITEALLMEEESKNSKLVQRVLKEITDLKIETRKTKIDQRVLVKSMKQEGNQRFWAGEIEEAIMKFTEGLKFCSLKMRKERMVLYSNRAQCYLLLRKPDFAIRDSTRALCLSNPVNSHNKSLWRRSQAYDMKGLAKESLMDCIMFVNGWISSSKEKIPYYAVRMIHKQMRVTWIFAESEAKFMEQSKISKSGLSTIDEEEEEPEMEWRRTTRRRRKEKSDSMLRELLRKCDVELARG